MHSRLIADSSFDFMQINSDFAGERTVRNTEEVVDFHNNSSIRVWYNEQTDGFASHWHTALEIIAPVTNYYDVTIRSKSYHIEPGEFLIIPPGEIHELFAPSTGCRFVFLFDISFFSNIIGFSEIQTHILQQPHFSEEYYPQAYEELYKTLNEIKDEYFAENEYTEFGIYSLLLKFFMQIGRTGYQSGSVFSDLQPRRQKEYTEKFSAIIKYINEHYMEDIQLEDCARRVGFSKYHFSRLFKEYSHYTFYDYLCFCRVKAAGELLTRSEYSITEVALQTGFQSISTFNRLFKKYKSCTPSEYRSKNENPYMSRTVPKSQAGNL